jgi:hypothetical protein
MQGAEGLDDGRLGASGARSTTKGAEGWPCQPAEGRRGGSEPEEERLTRSFRGGGGTSAREKRRGIPPVAAPRGLCPAAHAGSGEGAWWRGGGGVVALGFRPCRPNGSDAGFSRIFSCVASVISLVPLILIRPQHSSS